jgi:hypothetical protein
MTKRLTVVLASLILGLTGVLAAGAGAAPTRAGATPSNAKPVPGTYSGSTSQTNKTVTASVSRNAVRRIAFTYRIGCPNNVHLNGTMASSVLPIQQLAFASKFRIADGQMFKLAGVFTTSGRVKGTLSVTLNSAKYGSCRSGVISWSASR